MPGYIAPYWPTPTEVGLVEMAVRIRSKLATQPGPATAPGVAYTQAQQTLGTLALHQGCSQETVLDQLGCSMEGA